MAPGGDVGSQTFTGKLGPSVLAAKEMVAAGQGSTTAKFYDYEGSKGLQPINTTATNYLSWFTPDGAMNMGIAVRGMNPATPVLYIRSEEHTSELQSLMRISYAVFCLKK